MNTFKSSSSLNHSTSAIHLVLCCGFASSVGLTEEEVGGRVDEEEVGSGRGAGGVSDGPAPAWSERRRDVGGDQE